MGLVDKRIITLSSTEILPAVVILSKGSGIAISSNAKTVAYFHLWLTCLTNGFGYDLFQEHGKSPYAMSSIFLFGLF